MSSSSDSTKYEKCKQANISAIMGRFEKGKLFIRGRRIRNPKQALVIALKMADQKCKEKLLNRDALKIAGKIREFLDADPADIDRVRYADLNRIVIILEELPKPRQQELLILVLKKLQKLKNRNIEISRKGLEEFKRLAINPRSDSAK